MTVAELMAEVRAKMEKTASAAPAAETSAQTPAQTPASPQDEEMAKLAEDLYLSGRIAGIGWYDAVFAKLADEAVEAHGKVPGSAPDGKTAKSGYMGSVTDRLAKFHGGQQPGSAPKVPGGNPAPVLAEQVAPPVNKEKNPNPAK